jgi:Family of unknown function (DUF6502)
MNSQPTIVLDRVLRVMQPLVRLLVRNGVTYTVLAAALKRVFLEAARRELAMRGMPATDSAVTLLSGVHRRDVRQLSRGSESASTALPLPLGLAAQVVGRWMSDPAFLQPDGSVRVLPRAGEPGSFEDLVAGTSRDVRPRAVLDELLRLEVVAETDDGVALVRSGFAPRQGFQETADFLATNVHDHAAAAAANLQGDGNFLEQAVFVDEITAESAQAVHAAARAAWREALKPVLNTANLRHEHDQAQATSPERRHRARFGVYFFSERED